MLEREGLLDTAGLTLSPRCELCDKDDAERAWRSRPGPSRRERLGCGRLPVAGNGEVVDLAALLEQHDLTPAEIQGVYELANAGWVTEVDDPWPSCPRFWTRQEFIDPVTWVEAHQAMRRKAYLTDGALTHADLGWRERNLIEIARRLEATIMRKQTEARRSQHE